MIYELIWYSRCRCISTL